MVKRQKKQSQPLPIEGWPGWVDGYIPRWFTTCCQSPI